MSLTSEQARIQYTQASVAEAFSVPFYFLAAADLAVVRTRTDSDTTLVLTTDYTVTGAGTNPSSAIVTLVAGLAGDIITIYRNAAETQPTSLTNNGPFPASTMMRSLDRLTMLIQQLTLQMNRTIRVPVSNDETDALELSDREQGFPYFDSNGELTIYSLAALAEYIGGGGGGGGSVQSGTQAVASATNSHVITFDTPFSSPPNVVVSYQKAASDGDNIFATIANDSITETECVVEFSGETPAEGGFISFLASL